MGTQHQIAAGNRQDRWITIALEPLNRFETDFLNLSEQAVRMSEKMWAAPRSASYSIRSIWELKRRARLPPFVAPASISSISTLARTTGAHPGWGRSPGPKSRDALRDIGYDRIVAIEGFNPEIVDLANGACIWRPMAPTPDRLAGTACSS